jgi:hypothetical protein
MADVRFVGALLHKHPLERTIGVTMPRKKQNASRIAVEAMGGVKVQKLAVLCIPVVEECITQMVFCIPGSRIDVGSGWFVQRNQPAVRVDDGIGGQSTRTCVGRWGVYSDGHSRQDDGSADPHTHVVYPGTAAGDNVAGNVVVPNNAYNRVLEGVD